MSTEMQEETQKGSVEELPKYEFEVKEDSTSLGVELSSDGTRNSSNEATENSDENTKNYAEILPRHETKVKEDSAPVETELSSDNNRNSSNVAKENSDENTKNYAECDNVNKITQNQATSVGYDSYDNEKGVVDSSTISNEGDSVRSLSIEECDSSVFSLELDSTVLEGNIVKSKSTNQSTLYPEFKDKFENKETLFQIGSIGKLNKRFSRPKKSSKNVNRPKSFDNKIQNKIETIDKFVGRIKNKDFRTNITTICSVHDDVVRYWCVNCSKAKCEKCVNIVYSKSCISHSVIMLEDHVTAREKNDLALVKKKTSECLKSMDVELKQLEADFQNVELMTMVQEERIRQEFISFHALLTEEESNILGCLKQRCHEYLLENRMKQECCGKVIAQEAELSFPRVKNREEDLLTKLEEMNTTLKGLETMERDANLIVKEKLSLPWDKQDKFTLFKEKTFIKKRLSTFSESLELKPKNYTVFLNGSTLETPMYTSDLFECNSATNNFNDIEVNVEIFHKRKVLQCLRLRLNETIFNTSDRVQLISYSRYLVKARLAGQGFFRKEERYQNVLLVTGSRTDANQAPPKFDILCHIDGLRQPRKNPCFILKKIKPGLSDKILTSWKNSGLWLFTSSQCCKHFFDISPEELRLLSYSVDATTYQTMIQSLEDEAKTLCEHCVHSQVLGVVGDPFRHISSVSTDHNMKTPVQRNVSKIK